jgi:crotonobetainyl-CoA:carnitine CoA-transferase CaiB-like acyl-CoA transferase
MALYDCAFAPWRHSCRNSSPVDQGMGNRHSMAALWNVYKAEDGWMLVCAASDDQWQRITNLIGQPELAKDPRYLRVGDRVQRGAEVDPALQEWVGGRSIARCLEAFASIGIPSGPVVKADRYPREANLDHRRMIRRLIDPASGCDVFVPASPLRMTLTPGLSPAHTRAYRLCSRWGRRGLAATCEPLTARNNAARAWPSDVTTRRRWTSDLGAAWSRWGDAVEAEQAANSLRTRIF